MKTRRRNPLEKIREEHGINKISNSGSEHWLTWLEERYAWRINMWPTRSKTYFEFTWGPIQYNCDLPAFSDYETIDWDGKTGVMPKLRDSQLRKLGIANHLILEQMVQRMAEL